MIAASKGQRKPFNKKPKPFQKRQSKRKRRALNRRGPGRGESSNGVISGLVVYILDPATNRNSQYKRIPR